MPRRFKLRFNLGRGVNYKKWKLTYPDKSSVYFDPSEVTITLFNCKLHNNRKVAEEIFNGANKSVCSWLSAEKISVMDNLDFIAVADEITYNPRVTPNWVCNGENYDGKIFDVITSKGKQLFLF